MLRSAVAALAFVALAASAHAQGGDGVLRITLDQAHVAKLPSTATTVIIGNPAIADVTMLKNGAGVVVTGKGYGRTNLIALDAQGNLIDEEQIHVEPTRSVLVVQRGDQRQSYSCDPVCMPSAVLGDDSKVFGEISGQVTAHDALAKGGQGK
jgi:Flp pilus assembly secretin CpaC